MLLAREMHEFPYAHGKDKVRPRLVFPLLRVLLAPPQAVVFLESLRVEEAAGAVVWFLWTVSWPLCLVLGLQTNDQALK